MASSGHIGQRAGGIAHPALRWAGVVLLGGYALLAGALGLDRIAFDHPKAPAPIGWLYDADAAEAYSGQSIRDNQNQRAVFFGRRAVLSNPVDAHVVGVYGLALLLNNDTDAAEKVFNVSRLLGWRDDPTQAYLVDKAVSMGDMHVAAQHLDALLRQTPDVGIGPKLIARVLTFEQGRTELANQLRAQPDWAKAFVRDLDGLSDDDAFARFDTVMRAGPGLYDCATVSKLIDRLADAQLYTQAWQLDRRFCETGNGIVSDGTFANFDLTALTGSLQWQIARRGDVQYTPSTEPTGGQRLTIQSSAPSILPVLWQVLVIGEGRYHITWDMPDTRPDDASKMSVSLDCERDLGLAQTGKLVDQNAATYAVDVTMGSDCPAPKLVFWLAPNHAVAVRRVHVRFDGK